MFFLKSKQRKDQVKHQEEKIKDLEKEVSHYKMLTEELKEKIDYYRNREEYINTIIIDAEKRSNAMIEETQEQARENAERFEADLNQRIKVITQDTNRLLTYEMELRSKGEIMRKQLGDVLRAQLAEIEQLDFSAFHDLKDLVSETNQVSKDIVDNATQIIEFPELKPKDKESKPTIPVYQIDGGHHGSH